MCFVCLLSQDLEVVMCPFRELLIFELVQCTESHTALTRPKSTNNAACCKCYKSLDSCNGKEERGSIFLASGRYKN